MALYKYFSFPFLFLYGHICAYHLSQIVLLTKQLNVLFWKQRYTIAQRCVQGHFTHVTLNFGRYVISLTWCKISDSHNMENIALINCDVFPH